jgi:hypothetical protein
VTLSHSVGANLVAGATDWRCSANEVEGCVESPLNLSSDIQLKYRLQRNLLALILRQLEDVLLGVNQLLSLHEL